MAATPGPRILIAEDDRAVRQSLERTLRLEGFDVTAVRTGAEAVDAYAVAPPDLVILDVMMPGQSGWEVCRSIRETDSLKNTGVIMLTGVGQRMNEMTSPLYGADGHLDKPFEFEMLDDLITQVLDKRSHAKAG
jgi:DNA-binding response OmpR family regulator